MEETKGTIFDIKQMAVFDGPGIRTTVFIKGCPLRCKWCHNPEGLNPQPQLMVSDNGCLHCDACRKKCTHKDGCISCGECVRVCPMHLRRIAGTQYTAKELAAKLLKDRVIFDMNGGGVTLSGGEPTFQPEFTLQLLKELEGVHRAIETCGYCRPETFGEIIQNVDYIIMDIKMVDDRKHRYWTGQSNGIILENLDQVKKCGKPFMIRIPLIPGVNDDFENKNATAKLLQNVQTLERVELLPYHTTAGAKYHMVGEKYTPGFDTERPADKDISAFEKYNIPVRIM